MKVIKLKPDDLNFPLGKDVWEKQNIHYHGTSSIFTEELEKGKWSSKGLPYDLDEIQEIIRIYDSIRVRGTGQDFGEYFDQILYDYSLERINDNSYAMPVSITKDYWRARNYAINLGGETINAIINACKYFSQLVNNEDEHSNHLKRLDKGCFEFKRQYAGINVKQFEYLRIQLDSLEKCSMNFQDQSYLESCLNTLEPIRRKYEKLVSGSYPVVYGIEYGLNLMSSDLKDIAYYNETRKDYVIEKVIDWSKFAPENIVARVEYPDGISSFYEVTIGHYEKNNLLPWKNQK